MDIAGVLLFTALLCGVLSSPITHYEKPYTHEFLYPHQPKQHPYAPGSLLHKPRPITQIPDHHPVHQPETLPEQPYYLTHQAYQLSHQPNPLPHQPHYHSHQQHHHVHQSHVHVHQHANPHYSFHHHPSPISSHMIPILPEPVHHHRYDVVIDKAFYDAPVLPPSPERAQAIALLQLTSTPDSNREALSALNAG